MNFIKLEHLSISQMKKMLLKKLKQLNPKLNDIKKKNMGLGSQTNGERNLPPRTTNKTEGEIKMSNNNKNLEKTAEQGGQVDAVVSHEPMFFNDALEILGWQGGTIHQVLEVLRWAKVVTNQYHESSISGDWELMHPRLESLRSAISG